MCLNLLQSGLLNIFLNVVLQLSILTRLSFFMCFAVVIMPDIDFKCLWKSTEEGSTDMKCGRVVINRGDSSGCGRFQLFLNVKTNGPKQTLKVLCYSLDLFLHN